MGMRLSHNDYAALEQAIFELHEFRDLDRFRREAPAVLLKLIPSDYLFWPEYAIDPRACEQTLVDHVESSSRVTPGLARQMGAGIMKHPFTQHFINGGEQTALKISDFFTHNQFRNSGSVYDIYREWGFKYNLSVSLRAAPGRVAGVGLCDDRRDFTERDRLMLNLLQRHFDQAHHNSKLATARAAVPAKPLAAYDLTPREAEVAHWVAAGKTNPEISIILNCGVRTTEKHMERILEKIGVENRATAAVVIVRAERARTTA
jgi:DNA-binding CsgD family transcriptional regulator